MLEYEIYNWLNDHQITTPRYQTFDPDEELNALSYPAVLKIASPKVIHKTDVGGVVTDIENSEQLSKAKETIVNNLARHDIILKKGEDKFLVASMHKGIELFFGIVNDPVF